MELLAQVLAGAIIGAGIGSGIAAWREAEMVGRIHAGVRNAAIVAIMTLCGMLLGSLLMAFSAIVAIMTLCGMLLGSLLMAFSGNILFSWIFWIGASVLFAALVVGGYLYVFK